MSAADPIIGRAATAIEPAERLRFTGEIPFPLAGYAEGDLVNLNNFGTCRRTHLGVDIGELRVLTSPIDLVAVADAEVTQVDDDPFDRPGRFVVLRDGTRWYRYHHLDEIADGLEVGDRVEIGQSLGTMGNTGNTSWPHLHFEVWDGDGAFSAAGTVLDPVPLLPSPAGVQLNGRVCD